MPQVNNVENTLFQEIDSHKPKTRTPKKVLDRDDFLLLFVKQLEYQDPMHPLENNEMATQLALFNQLDELYILNDNINKLVLLNKERAILEYSSLVGKNVKIEGNIGRIENGKFLGAEIVTEETIPEAKIKIYDENGNLVRTLDLGTITKGEHKIEWDGKDEEGNDMPDGNYILDLEYKESEEELLYKIYITGQVTSVSFNKEEPKVIINGSLEISINEIFQIINEKVENANNEEEEQA